MSKESRIDEQIQHFYDNVPNVGDALPLKEYLLKHEDSRMAWYLLGKEYEGKGDTAKATYCFAQAGEIYEAFESKWLRNYRKEIVEKGKLEEVAHRTIGSDCVDWRSHRGVQTANAEFRRTARRE